MAYGELRAVDRSHATAVASLLNAEIISKYALCRISLHQQPVERSMRFELQSFHETMVPPTRELYEREEWTEVSRHRLFQSNSTRTGWWRSIVTATSLVPAHAITGIAWSAVVIYPNLLNPPSNQFDDDEPADDLSFVELANDRLVSRDAVMRSRIVHSEEGPLVTNGLVTFEIQGGRGLHNQGSAASRHG